MKPEAFMRTYNGRTASYIQAYSSTAQFLNTLVTDNIGNDTEVTFRA